MNAKSITSLDGLVTVTLGEKGFMHITIVEECYNGNATYHRSKLITLYSKSDQSFLAGAFNELLVYRISEQEKEKQSRSNDVDDLPF